MMRRFVLNVLAGIAVFSVAGVCSAATINASVPPSAVAGTTFSVPITVSTTADEPMNAAGATVSFPTDKLSVVSIDQTGIVSMWAQAPAFSNTDGTVTFQGVVYNPGFAGTAGKLFTIKFKALDSGTATLKVSDASVLANDGQGTDITSGASGGTVTIQGGKERAETPIETVPVPKIAAPATNASGTKVPLLAITSPTHPDQNAWYPLKSVKLAWNASQANAVRLGYGTDPDVMPQVLHKPAINEMDVTLDDGVYYFAAQQKTADGWSDPVRFKVAIDSTPPQPFSIAIKQQESPCAKYTADVLSGAAAQASFIANDGQSGVDHYSVDVPGKPTVTIPGGSAEKWLPLSGTQAGTTSVTVTAFDKAGNSVASHADFYSPCAVQESTQETGSRSLGVLFSIIWTVANYIAVILIAGVLLSGVGYLAWQVWEWAHCYRSVLLKSVLRRDAVLDKEFEQLYSAVKVQLAELLAEKERRPLSHGERRVLDNLARIVYDTERKMKKEGTTPASVRSLRVDLRKPIDEQIYKD